MNDFIEQRIVQWKTEQDIWKMNDNFKNERK